MNEIQHLKDNKKTSYHEVITNSRIRLFFDVDDTRQDYQAVIEQAINAVVSQLCPGIPLSLITIKSQTKFSYHIHTNVSCELSMARYIAQQVRQLLPQDIQSSIDQAPYRKGASLRLPNTVKINTDGTVVKSIYTYHGDYMKILINNVDQTYAITTPFHLYDSPMIDQQYIFNDIDISDVHM